MRQNLSVREGGTAAATYSQAVALNVAPPQRTGRRGSLLPCSDKGVLSTTHPPSPTCPGDLGDCSGLLPVDEGVGETKPTRPCPRLESCCVLSRARAKLPLRVLAE